MFGESGFEPDSNVVDVYVRYLRNKLGRHPDIIETVRGAGYILNSLPIGKNADLSGVASPSVNTPGSKTPDAGINAVTGTRKLNGQAA